MRKSRTSPLQPKRSPCPVAYGLDIFGDRWTLIVVRDLFRGAQRFKEFMASPERIPSNILTDRLMRLIQCGLADFIPAADGSRHAAYRLTEKGRALKPVILAVRDWGLKWEKGTKALLGAS